MRTTSVFLFKQSLVVSVLPTFSYITFYECIKKLNYNPINVLFQTHLDSMQSATCNSSMRERKKITYQKSSRHSCDSSLLRILTNNSLSCILFCKKTIPYLVFYFVEKEFYAYFSEPFLHMTLPCI